MSVISIRFAGSRYLVASSGVIPKSLGFSIMAASTISARRNTSAERAAASKPGTVAVVEAIPPTGVNFGTTVRAALAGLLGLPRSQSNWPGVGTVGRLFLVDVACSIVGNVGPSYPIPKGPD